MTDNPDLILVDGSSYLYRAFHALPPLTTKDGRPTGAVRGVASMLRKMCQQYPSTPVVVVFDAKGKTFRDDIYADYKANRPPMPDELRLQVEPLHALIEAMGLPMLVVPGVEADDVIGTLAREAAEAGKHVLISTGDKDLAQLVNDQVTLINTMNDTVMDIDGVRNKFGIGPELVIDLLALMGDKVDNIPGVPGVGEKTAVALLQGIGGIDAIYERIEEVPTLSVRGAKTLKIKLEQEKEKALLSRQLATIKCDLDLDYDADGFAVAQPDHATLLQMYTDLEFNTWREELMALDGRSSEQAEAVVETIDVQYETVLDESSLTEWVERLRSAPAFVFDTETTSLQYMQARIVGVAVAVEVGKAAYIPFGHAYMGAPTQLSEQQVLGALKPLLEDPSKPKIGQNLKYDMSVLANHGIRLQGVAADTMLESYVLNSTASRHDMDTLALRHLDYQTTKFEEVAGKGAKQVTFDQVALEQATPYAAEDADITLRLHQRLGAELEQVETLASVYHQIEMPLVPVLSRLERNGALIDTGLLFEQSHELGEKMRQLEEKAHELAGGAFNLASPKQLQEILFEKQGLPVIAKTPKGQPSTAEAVLQELAEDYELPKVIMEYRGVSKLKSTYTDRLPEQVLASTGRIHTSYHQAVTATGRLSSSDPNLQNIPVRSAEGRRIRQAFIAPEGRMIVAADYSQIELRIMAHLSGDEGLLNAFRDGLDVHRATAAEVFGESLETVSDNQRRSAKAINFGLIYGMSAFGLAKQLGVGRGEAQSYIDRYFARYPGVQNYMETTRKQAAQAGFVETLFGRRLYLPDIKARNPQLRQAAERTAINAPMQGTAADIIKRAMIATDAWLTDSAFPALMIMQVHDELVFEVDRDCLDDFKQQIQRLMSGSADLNVDLIVDVGYGENWDEAH